jgi:hypothetical protein
MKKIQSSLFLLLILFSCKQPDLYNPNRYYDIQQQNAILTSIITYVFEAPPYTAMKDRFNFEHRSFYLEKTRFFTLQKLYIGSDSIHYFYITIPSPKPLESRGVAGRFKTDKNFRFTYFREEFVTPIMPTHEVTGKCAFMFDEMVKGTLRPYLKMQSYVQWPNEISYYDSITYEWKIRSGVIQ